MWNLSLFLSLCVHESYFFLFYYYRECQMTWHETNAIMHVIAVCISTVQVVQISEVTCTIVLAAIECLSLISWYTKHNLHIITNHNDGEKGMYDITK
jgi:presenilin-like A22 family membrane protease